MPCTIIHTGITTIISVLELLLIHLLMERDTWNFSSLKKYISEIENNNFAAAGYEIPDEEQRLNEYVMLALRSQRNYG